MIHPDLESPIAQSRGDDKEDLLERYDFGTKLGRGSFGTVRIVTDKISREIYACKSIQKRAKNGASIEQIAREVEVMKRIRHPHVVGLHEVYETPAKLHDHGIVHRDIKPEAWSRVFIGPIWPALWL